MADHGQMTAGVMVGERIQRGSDPCKGHNLDIDMQKAKNLHIETQETQNLHIDMKKAKNLHIETQERQNIDIDMKKAKNLHIET
jgi:hypothetical protein